MYPVCPAWHPSCSNLLLLLKHRCVYPTDVLSACNSAHPNVPPLLLWAGAPFPQPGTAMAPSLSLCHHCRGSLFPSAMDLHTILPPPLVILCVTLIVLASFRSDQCMPSLLKTGEPRDYQASQSFGFHFSFKQTSYFHAIVKQKSRRAGLMIPRVLISTISSCHSSTCRSMSWLGWRTGALFPLFALPSAPGGSVRRGPMHTLLLQSEE